MQGGSAGEDNVNSSTLTGSKYFVLWYDSKMKNYELFIDYLLKKRMVQAEI